jgi:hypothetical protein
MATTRRFRLIAGKHFQDEADGTVKTYSAKSGDNIIESDKELDKLFANKFERIEGSEKVVPDKDPAPVTSSEKPKPTVTEFSTKPDGSMPRELATAEGADVGFDPKAAGGDDLGEDVTEDFEGAAEKDLQVFIKARKYHVTDKDNPGKPLNEEPLNKAAAKAFIKDYGEEEEE